MKLPLRSLQIVGGRRFDSRCAPDARLERRQAWGVHNRTDAGSLFHHAGSVQESCRPGTMTRSRDFPLQLREFLQSQLRQPFEALNPARAKTSVRTSLGFVLAIVI